MMCSARRITLLVAFYLLASAATANAECLEDGWSKLPEPKAAMDTRCLPDTVDPRGPKGK